jgi:23S rRNA pseudouridine1911/1915/1917 synthase
MSEYYTVPPEDEGRRLDRWLSERIPELSRVRVQKLIREGLVRVNGEPVTKPSAPVEPEMRVEIEIPASESQQLEPEEMPLEILYEDDDIVAVNKPSGMVVYPAAGHAHGTLVQGLLYGGRQLASVGAPERPGVVHRLDKETSGVIIFAKSDSAYYALVKQFKERAMEKLYLALARGLLQEETGEIEAPLGRDPRHRKRIGVRAYGGRPAHTTFRVLRRFEDENVTFLEARPHTGRTHQIRVHLAAIGHPIVGDPLYGPRDRQRKRAPRLMLHAWKLAFTHPGTGERVELTAPPPPEFRPYWEERSREASPEGRE